MHASARRQYEAPRTGDNLTFYGVQSTHVCDKNGSTDHPFCIEEDVQAVRLSELRCCMSFEDVPTYRGVVSTASSAKSLKLSGV